jgi:hypothetical protein
MPRRPDISDIFGRGSFLFGRRPRGNMGSDFRMPQIGDMRFRGRLPQKNTAFSKAIRRLKEQIRNQQPIPERMPVSNAPSFNPTIFGQPIGDMDFSQMPKISPEDMMNLQVPTDMPMTQDLPEVAPVGMMAGRTLQQDFPAEPRMMMQAGEEVSLERELFSLQSQLENLKEQLRLDRSYNDDQAVINTSAEMAAIQKRIQEILQESGRTISDLERQQIGRRTMSDMDKGSAMSDLDMSRPQLAGGGDFPDLTGDGKVTQADILKGRGVQLKAEGGEMMTQENEIDAMLGGMGSEVEGAMEDLEQMAPEMEMIDQLVTMVVQMIQQGASEEEVMMFLREQGLDDEDIGTVLQLVAEMSETEAMPQDGIGAELEQLA